MKTILDVIIRFFIIAIQLFTLVSFIVCNVIFMSKYSEVFSIKEWIWFLPACLLIISTYLLARFLEKNRKESTVIIIGLLLANLLFVFFICSYPTEPVSDWQLVWNAANQMANGTFTGGITPGHYMHEIPYQQGMALLESYVIKIFGIQYSVFKALNVLIMDGILLCIYHFSKRKSSQRAAVYVYISSSVFLCWAMSVPQFTNHQIGTLLMLITLYCFEKEAPWYGLLSGAVLALMNYLRPMGILLVVTYFCYTVYELFSKKPFAKAIAKLALCLVTYYGCSFLIDSYMIGKGYTDTYISRSNRNLYHKITYGLYDSKIDGTIAKYDYDYEAYDAAFKEEITEQLTNHKKELLENIANKMCRYLGMFDYAFEMTYNHDQTVWSAYPVKAYYSVQWFQYVIYSGLALLGYLGYIKIHHPDLYQIFFVGNTLVYLFVEAFSTYRFENYFYVLFLAGYGLCRISELQAEKANINQHQESSFVQTADNSHKYI